jgi:hypothetical protein
MTMSFPLTSMLKRSSVLWILAVVITVLSAYYQRVTGPTYPLSGSTVLGGKEIAYRLDRSHVSDTDAPVTLRTDDPLAIGVLEWKRHNTDDPWTTIIMNRDRGTLTAALPHQPPAGKIDYRITVTRIQEAVVIPSAEGTTIRFKGEVPTWVLVIHVIAMFGAMLLSTRTGLEVFAAAPAYSRSILWTLGFLFVGGLVLGPVVQRYAFGAYWTGWPFGGDLTDNKTLLAFVGWVVAAGAVRRGKRPVAWVLGASILLLAVYMIPHSVLGSELQYKNNGPTVQGVTDSSLRSK